MSKARDLADLLDSDGDVVSGALDNVDTTVTSLDLPAGSVLQVKTVTKTDTFSTSSGNTWTDITGLSVTITPSSADNKILILGNFVVGSSSGNLWSTRLLRGSTVINAGDANGSKGVGLGSASYREVNSMEVRPIAFLDSPNTTSAVTYKLQINTETGGYPVYLNRTHNDINDYRQNRAASNITVLEIAQ